MIVVRLCYGSLPLVAKDATSQYSMVRDAGFYIQKIHINHLGPTSRVSYYNEVNCARLAKDIYDIVSIRKATRCYGALLRCSCN